MINKRALEAGKAFVAHAEKDQQLLARQLQGRLLARFSELLSRFLSEVQRKSSDVAKQSLREAYEEALNSDEYKELRDDYEKKIQALKKEAQAAEATWEARFGELMPKDVDDFIYWARRFE